MEALMDKELIPWLVLASMAGGLGAFWVAKAWQRIRNGWRPGNRYPEYRPRR
jgi:hypothetical protein